MNLEKFHAVLLDLSQDDGFSEIPELMVNLRNHLQNKVNEPAQPAHQNGVVDGLETLSEALLEASSDQYPPTWRQILDELEISDLLGAALNARVKEIFQRNQITDSAALSEINALLELIEPLTTNIQNIIAGLDYLEIDTEALNPGEAQLAYLVPRDAVKNNLQSFAKELGESNKFLRVFSEIATGTRRQFKIKTLSATDFSIYLELAAEVGACLAFAIERIVNLYKSLLEIRSLKKGLVEQNLSPDALEGIDAHAENLMSDGIRSLAKEIIEDHKGDIKADRRNELEIELRFSLNAIANRLDQGFSFEVTAEPLEEPDSEEDDDLDSDAREKLEQYLKEIIDSSESTRFLKLEGSPILKLEEKKLSPTKKTSKKVAE